METQKIVYPLIMTLTMHLQNLQQKKGMLFVIKTV